MHDADQQCIESKGISSIDLMEHASMSFANQAQDKIKPDWQIAIICGSGNNGGDGLALCRILRERNFNCTPYLVDFKNKLSDDTRINLDLLKDVVVVRTIDDFPDLNSFDLVIDAIFGSGLNKPVDGIYADLIEHVNASSAFVYSIDLPSGMPCDSEVESVAIKADWVGTFQRPKRSFFLKENAPFIMEWEVIDIGLDEEFIQSMDSNYYELNHRISSSIKAREKYSHKGSFGHALIIAGSYGKMGAAVLAAKACLRSGAGLLTVVSPKCGYEILQTSIPEAMCLCDVNEMYISAVPELSSYNTIGIGPGLGNSEESVRMLESLLKTTNKPMVLDADALNILSRNMDLIHHVPATSVLTPHPKEFERLVGKSRNMEEALEKQIKLATSYGLVVVLKGAHTSICDSEGNLFFNTSGNPGMATGGSGDVLTGIITGLMAQNYTSIDAALLAVYFHGRAGDIAAQEKGMNALIASDLIEHLRIEKGIAT